MTATIGVAAAVLVEQIDQILVVTINRPHARNAVSAAVTQGLVDAWRGPSMTPTSVRWWSPAQATRPSAEVAI